jgi:fatty acid desaturase
MLRTRSLFRHSPHDLLPALGGVASVACLLATFLAFDSLSRAAALLVLVLAGLLVCWNLHCVAHCFLHHPFFRKRWLNRVYGVMESLAIGVPHSLYRHYHMSRHSRPGARSEASFYRHGKEGAPEPMWRYCLLSFIRIDQRALLRSCTRHGPEQVAWAVAEAVVLVLFWMGLLIADWRAFLGFYVPSCLLGWMLAFAQEYLEQYGARPDNPFASAVNSRSRLYNLLTFNHGYQVEHQWNAHLHWTRLPELHRRLAPHLRVNDTPTLRGPHLTAMLEYFLRRRVRLWRQRKAARSAVA